MKTFQPAKFQKELPLETLIRAEKPSEEAVPLDVLFVGGGPAGLAGAIELARLVKRDAENGGSLGPVEIGVLEKAPTLGGHCLSGAVINPRALKELFPDLKVEDFPLRTEVKSEAVYLMTESGHLRIPTPPTMNNHGNYVASICEVVRWMGTKAEELGVNIMTGFPAESLLTEGQRVIGVRTTPAGLNREAQPGSSYMPGTDVTAQLTVLCEGTRGTLTQGYLNWQKITSPNPQIFALGVKEIWKTKTPLKSIIHTMGWPLPSDAFGGSFMYPMADDLIAFGLVVGLDYKSAKLDVHELLQEIKQHPLFTEYLRGGELVEWGAKTIPEGGYYALPEKLHGDGLLICGDAAGMVDVPSLKGIHYAMQSGIYAGRTAFEALKAKSTSSQELRRYDTMIHGSYIVEDMKRTRNMRLAFKSGFYLGGLKAGLMTVTGGNFPGARIPVESDAHESRETDLQVEALANAKVPSALNEGIKKISKVDGVFHSGNKTRDDIPSHLIVGKDIPPDIARFYAHMCPAGVYELNGDTLSVNAPNCVDCKATDVLGPRWTPREGGSGPDYKQM